MSHDLRVLTSIGLVAVSSLALGACGTDIDPPPPDLSGAAVHHYRITSIEVADSAARAGLVGFDLDADGGVDNQLGGIYATMQDNESLYEVEAPAAVRLGDDVGWVLSLYDGNGIAGARIARGVVTGDHVLPLDEVEPATGPSLDPAFVLDGGSAMLPIGILTDALGASDPAWVSALVTKVTVEKFDRTTARVRLGVALPAPEIRPAILANLSAFFTSALAAGHSDYGAAVDADHDGVVTEAELTADGLFESLLAPDVELDEPALSLGIWLNATEL